MNSAEPLLSDQIWNSLKMVVIIIAIIAPVIIVFIAIRFRRAKKRLIDQQQTNQSMVEQRMGMFKRIGPKLNDLLCYYTYTGNWKELFPADILKLKRELDKEVKSNTPLFSEDLIKKYDSFMLLCFVSHSGWEHKEKIKSNYQLRQEHMAEWDPDWIHLFDTNNVLDGITVKERYDDLMASFKENLSLSSQST
jgi:hypothetical protein